MKNRKTFYITVAVLIVGLLSWYWWPRSVWQTQQKAQGPVAAKANIVSSQPATAPVSISPTIGEPTQNPVTGQLEVKINPALPDAVKMQLLLDAQNNSQIDFYGKVVNQYDEPVIGVKVRGVIILSSMAGTANQDNFTETDGNGLFKFNNLRGPNFGVALSKDGYALYIGKNWSKDYKPDPDSPMVFTIWKLQGAEPMVHQSFIVMLPCDGTPKSVNLRTGKTVSTGGDMTVALTRNPVQIVRGTPFEWTLTIEVASGGFQQIQDAYPYEAPEDGYQPTLTITTGPNPQSYMNTYSGAYYYKSPDGKFGRVTFGLHADYQPPPTLLGIDIYLNPSGSRNLEFDRSKQIK